jgi:glycerophosphoryl diester phosphodiesterase
MQKSSSPLIIGHRGAAALLPENTMASFRLAFEQGAPMIEFDVHLSKDRVPVIIHDAKLDRTTNGKGYVSRFTPQELRKWDAGYFFDPMKRGEFAQRGKGLTIPTFEEMLQEFKTQRLAVEIKENTAEVTHKVVELVKKYGAENRVVVGSKYYEVSATMKQHYPHIQRFMSKREFVTHYFSYKSGNKKVGKDVQAIASMPLEACGLAFGDGNFIQYLHERGITVFYWTINNPIVMKELKKRGADGIITDNPQLAKKTLG